MYDIIPLIIILISFLIITIIAIKKFPALANLDALNIPAEKEARFKEQIVSNRLKRIVLKWNSKIVRFLRPIPQSFNDFFKWIYAKLHDMRENYKGETYISSEELDVKINGLIEEAEELKRQDDLINAEKKLIEIIGLDSKNIKAFKLLARLYYERKDYEEAKQTFEHIIKLKEDDEDVYDGLAHIAQEGGNLDLAKEDYMKALKINSRRGETFYNLSLVYEETKSFDEAIENMKKALKIEPNNPRYLDTMLRISIIKKDKILALNTYEKLNKVNPENQKLPEFKAQINDL